MTENDWKDNTSAISNFEIDIAFLLGKNITLETTTTQNKLLNKINILYHCIFLLLTKIC